MSIRKKTIPIYNVAFKNYTLESVMQHGANAFRDFIEKSNTGYVGTGHNTVIEISFEPNGFTVQVNTQQAADKIAEYFAKSDVTVEFLAMTVWKVVVRYQVGLKPQKERGFRS